MDDITLSSSSTAGSNLNSKLYLTARMDSVPSVKVNKNSDAASSVTTPTSRDVNTKGGSDKIWKASEIERMKSWEFEKFEKEIDKARSEGRIDLSS